MVGCIENVLSFSFFMVVLMKGRFGFDLLLGERFARCNARWLAFPLPRAILRYLPA